MVQKVQILRTLTANPPTGLAEGELSVEMAAPTRLWVGVPAGVDANQRVLISDRTADKAYVDSENGAQDIIIAGKPNITVAEDPPPAPAPGDFWFESDTGIMWFYYDDGNSQQWLQVNGSGGSAPAPVDAYTKAESDAKFVELAGDTMTGPLGVSGSVTIDTTNAAAQPGLSIDRNGNSYWGLLCDGVANGNNFIIERFNGAGGFLGTNFTIAQSNGQTIIGTNSTNPPLASGLHVSFSGGTTNHGLSIRGAVDGGYMEAFSNAAGTIVGTITSTTTNTAYNTASDGRLKEDLKSFDAGNVVDKTNVYDFAWKATGVRDYGVIAQQAVDVYPAAVHHNEDLDHWFIDYSKYVPVLLQEMKAMRERMREMEAELRTLKTATPKGR